MFAEFIKDRRVRVPNLGAFLVGSIIFFGLLAAFLPVSATSPAYMSDTLSVAAPTMPADHTIVFMTTKPVPPGGKIIITPEDGSFNIPSSFDYTDVDLATSTDIAGTYIDRTLGLTTDSSTDAVSVVSGTSSQIVITLNDSAGIDAGVFVQVRLGLNAVYGDTPSQQIMNPDNIQSYHIFLETRDASDTTLDSGATMIAIIQAVTTHADTVRLNPPFRFNGLPSGTLPAGIRLVELSLNTDELAKCSYATTTGVPYASMGNYFTSSSFQLLHTTIVSTPTDDTTYTFYVRCVDRVGLANPDDYIISFYLQPALPAIIPGEPGGPPIPPAPTYPPYPAVPLGPQMEITGWTAPRSKIVILKDNVDALDGVANGGGYFDLSFTNLVQGTYSFGVYSLDSSALRTATYGTTLTLVAGTKNAISDIFLSPTISAATTTIRVGSAIDLNGQSVASSAIDISMIPQQRGAIPDSQIVNATTVSDSGGAWSYRLPTTGLKANTYLVRARASTPLLHASPWSLPVYVGVGTKPSPDFCRRSDLNNDSKVNLVDFSILLYHWNSSDAIADINMDGRVNLTDFSVMLYCWTG